MSKTDRILQRLLRLHPNKLIDLKLDRILRLLEALGRPQDRIPPTIHVAGTNGKGSTIAHLRAFLEAAGQKVHVYTSPHLVRFNERIRLAGKLVSDAALNEALELCEKLNGDLPITYFEITTAAAFHLFAQNRADYLLLEVGLGGRFDATNVVGRPLGTIITPVSMDHREYLGDDLKTIAREKAGILKCGAPAVIGKQDNEARDAIKEEATKLAVHPRYWGQDFEAFEQHGKLIYQDETGLLDLPPSALAGTFQVKNAGLAIAAVRYFKLPVSDAQIAEGLKMVSWPGRLMKVTEGALHQLVPSGCELWLDGGHNVAGGEAAAAALAAMPQANKRPLVLIFGTYSNKDASGFLSVFKGVATRIITVPIEGERSAWGPSELAQLARGLGFESRAKASFEAALAEAAETPNARIVLCGSLHLAGQFLAQNKTPPS
ncbi:MAG TPA: bifunctional folylpolyglutamate synthase/dihydrofolate synthase [Devosia sp.]|nr:bifunctional folylpolyglutamate synthase/dihydrofolate synthase [Devosia sp.]